MREPEKNYSRLPICVLDRDRERLLFRFPGDPTVGIRRDEKESCSMHRDLCVGTGFGSF